MKELVGEPLLNLRLKLYWRHGAGSSCLPRSGRDTLRPPGRSRHGSRTRSSPPRWSRRREHRGYQSNTAMSSTAAFHTTYSHKNNYLVQIEARDPVEAVSLLAGALVAALGVAALPAAAQLLLAALVPVHAGAALQPVARVARAAVGARRVAAVPRARRAAHAGPRRALVDVRAAAVVGGEAVAGLAAALVAAPRLQQQSSLISPGGAKHAGKSHAAPGGES